MGVGGLFCPHRRQRIASGPFLWLGDREGEVGKLIQRAPKWDRGDSQTSADPGTSSALGLGPPPPPPCGSNQARGRGCGLQVEREASLDRELRTLGR